MVRRSVRNPRHRRQPQSFFLGQAKVRLFYAGEVFGAEYGAFVRLKFGCARAVLSDAIERMAGALARGPQS